MAFKSILIIVQCICILGIFIEILLILRKMKGSLHLYLLLSFIALLTNEIGYLLELVSKNKESYTAALKFSYFGKIWYAFLMFLFVAELTRIKIPTIVKYLLLSFQAFTYMVIFTVEYNTLYYSYFDVRRYNGFMRSEHGNGIIYRINMTIQILYILAGIYFLVKDLNKRRRKKERLCVLTVIAAVLTEAIFLIVQLIRIPGVSEYYDVTMVGYFIGTILMLIAIIYFNLLGTVEIAKEFVIDRISEGIIAVDNDDVIEYYNKPAEKIYPGLGPDPLLKRRYGEICWDDDEILNGIKQAVINESNIEIGDRIYTPEANDLFNGDEIIGKIYVLVDDTEHYRYMAELEKQKEIADSANKAKSRFLANMSHEIRTPINVVLGFDEMIIRESSEKSIRKYAADIMSASKTLLSLINDILDLSKAEAGKMEIIPQQYELASLINDLNNLVRSGAEKKGLKFNLNVNRHIPNLLFGDEVRIRQCVTNLLTNAVKYTREGFVTLHVSCSDIKKDEGHLSIELRFEVEDSGIGMKPETLEDLFSPYKRIEEERNRNIEGTGLGMSITRQLLELMDSDLKVESEYGKGTRISFEIMQEVILPDEIGDISGRISETFGEEAYRELFHAPEARILVVDDTEMNMTVIKSLLKKTQIGIDTASGGKDAIKLALKNEYDAIFIDHMMPDMDGIETLDIIRKEGKNTDAPAIALTANAISGAEQMYLKAGFTDYLSKPVDGIKLERMLFGILPKEKILTWEAAEGTERKDTAGDRQGAHMESGVYEFVTMNPDERSDTLPEWLINISEIDLDNGLKYCGGIDGYLSIIEAFHQTASYKADEIETLFKDKDINNYTIKVHALKSSARIIGANDLSELAKKLEKAGDDNDVQFIEDNTGTLLKMYRKLDKELSKMDEISADFPLLSSAEMKEAYQTMIEVAKSMDYGMMHELLKKVRQYRLEGADDEIVCMIEDLLTKLEWDEIIKTIETKS